jgi:hypothetical protein
VKFAPFELVKHSGLGIKQKNLKTTQSCEICAACILVGTYFAQGTRQEFKILMVNN